MGIDILSPMFNPEDASSPGMRRRYALVIVVEVLVLVTLWAVGRVYG